MQTIQIELDRLHSAQQDIKDEQTRFNVGACGRRFGKTKLGEDELIESALQGYPTAWFAPTYKMLLEVWREMVTILRPIASRINTSERRIELITSGIIEFWSLDKPDVARGRKYKRIVIDEAAMVPALEEAWQNVIRPTLTDYRGDAFFFSTPKGRNFFWVMYQWGLDPDRPHWSCWRKPTTDNPFISDEEIEAAREELPERVFQQEYLAEFLEGEGVVFRNIMACMEAGMEPNATDHEGHYIVAGLDWGKHNDFTAISVGCVTCKEELWRDRFNKIDYAFQRERVKVGYNIFSVSALLAERNAMGEPNIEQLSRDGLMMMRGPDGNAGFNTTASTKPPLIENLALVFERAEWQFQDDPVWTGEIAAYERTVSKITGRSQYSAPEGMHDDTVIARALMVWAGNMPNPQDLYAFMET